MVFAKRRTVCTTREIIVINGERLVEDLGESLVRESFRHGESEKTSCVRVSKARCVTLNGIKITNRLNCCRYMYNSLEILSIL